MKTIVLKDFGGSDQFELQDVPMPAVEPNEVLIQINACAFNPIDYQMRLGLGESKLLKSQILGREFSGVVVDAGDTSFKVGDRVYAYCGSLASNGAYATHIAIPAALVAPMPDSLNFLQAAAIPMVSLTALQCFERLMVLPHETVFMTGGAGGVGTVLIQLLRSAGIKKIVTTAGNAASRKALQKLGLPDDAILDYRQSELAEKLIAANAGRLFDYCIDIVGGRISEVASSVLKVYGGFADIAALKTEECSSRLFDKATTVYNIANYAMAASGESARLAYYGEKLAGISALFTEGKIAPPEVLNVGGLSTTTVAEAHRVLEGNAANGRKLVMQVHPG